MEHQKGDAKLKWLVGCGIGCLAIIIILSVITAILVSISFRRSVDLAAHQSALKLKTEYAEWKANNKVPADEIPLFDEMIELAQKENTKHWWVDLITTQIRSIFADGKVSEDELTQASEVRDFVQSNPSSSLWQFSVFVQAHPELKGTADKMLEVNSKRDLPR